MTIPTFKLADGHSIPAIAFGAGTKWYKNGQPGIDKDLIKSTVNAIHLGFNHLDGAEVYNTDRELGTAITESGKARKDLFLTDKFFSGNKEGTAKSAAANPYEALKESLARYKLDYVDLYLLHTPFIKKETHGYSLVEAWNSLEKLKDEGLTKSIGVSNFDVDSLKEILNSKPKYQPVVNQIEYSPNLQNQNPGIVEFAKANNILIEAYSPLGPLTTPPKDGEDNQLHPYVLKLAEKYGKSDSQILLRWVYENGILPVTTSGKEERLKEYLQIFGFELTKEEHSKIAEYGALRHLRKY